MPRSAASQLAMTPAHRSRRLDDCVAVNDLDGDGLFDNIDVTACYDFDSLSGVAVSSADKNLNGEVTALDCYIMNLQVRRLANFQFMLQTMLC